MKPTKLEPREKQMFCMSNRWNVMIFKGFPQSHFLQASHCPDRETEGPLSSVKVGTYICPQLPVASKTGALLHLT